MTPAKFSSTYLVRNPFSYCFRMAVPKDLQPSFGKKELRYSLKTRYLNDAENMARLMAGNIKMIFHGLRRGDPSLKDLTPELVNQLVKKHHREALEYYKKPINPFSNDKESYDYYLAHKIKTAQDLKIQINALEFFQDEYKFQLATGKYDEVDSKAQELLEEANVQYDKNSELYCALCQGLLKTEIACTAHDIARLKGEGFDGHFDATDDRPSEKPVDQITGGQLLSQVIPKFVSENEIKWTEKTKSEVIASLDLLLEVLGDVPIQTIDRARVAHYKDVLKKLPPNNRWSVKEV